MPRRHTGPRTIATSDAALKEDQVQLVEVLKLAREMGECCKWAGGAGTGPKIHATPAATRAVV